VILDSPPLLSVADTLVLAGLADAVLMVCVPGLLHRRELQQSHSLMAQVGRSISGVVLNKMERNAGYGRYGYYYHYDYDRDSGPWPDDGSGRHSSRGRASATVSPDRD
jgi:Mrp family chromosome partitioning ATPase